jgi:hypothetical protein
VSEASLNAFAARKRVELAHKVAGLRAEFDAWTRDAGQSRPLRKHQSQLERLFAQLGGMVDAAEEAVAQVDAQPADVLGDARAVQMTVLEVHRLWDHYRTKLSLRYVPWFHDFLAAADDLAWECYEPARVAAGGSRRAAPLVFLTGEFSPYTHAGEDGYAVEPMPGALDGVRFREIAAELPVPVVGVPWYQVAHLPDAPVIGHEVGHDLELELGLTAAVRAHAAPVLATLDPDRAYAWGEWLAELHADLVGVMCTGPAFATAMADLLAADPVQVADEARLAAAWQPHPPASLRVRALAEALGLMGFALEAATLLEAFPVAGDDRFAGDVAPLVRALWEGPHSGLGGSLASVLAFAGQQDAETVRDTLLAGYQATSPSVRALIAGVRLAYDADPAGFDRPRGPQGKTPQQLVLDQLRDLRDDNPRAEEVQRAPTADEDRAAGRELFARVSGLLAAGRDA